MTEVERLRALLVEAWEALHCEDDGDGVTSHRCGRCDEFVDRNDKVRDRIKAALAEPLEDTQESNTPKCEHGVEYGGMGVGCCPRCDQKALILASTETPKVKA